MRHPKLTSNISKLVKFCTFLPYIAAHDCETQHAYNPFISIFPKNAADIVYNPAAYHYRVILHKKFGFGTQHLHGNSSIAENQYIFIFL